ncbi:MAG TPA: CRTAC1 family protein, partial [Lacipirellulaceae bacterium]
MNWERTQAVSDGEIDPDTLERDDAVIGVALRWSLAVIVVIAIAIGTTVYALRSGPPVKPVQQTDLAEVATRAIGQATVPNVPFVDITQQAGINFRHSNAATGGKLLPETMGGGCAFFDFDNDGDQDLLLVNSLDRWPWDKQPSETAATSALYRNDGRGNFTDVTAGSGLDVSLYGMGAAVGDYDNDGNVDVFISALGTNRLFHNEGEGKFRDATDVAGVGGGDDEWSTCCGWLDYDNDGDLDLFVGNYVKWSREYDEGQNFQLTGGGRAYGRPQNFEGTFPYLYRNEGGGRFRKVAQQAGLHVRNGDTGVSLAKSLGVVFADLDEDGWVDMLVANDTVQNFLFHNQRDGTFREIAATSGIAFDMNGNARGAMGIDVARLRHNEVVGVAIGNFANEMTALYVSYGDQMQFMDEAIPTGLGPVTRTSLTFGLFYFDYDLDGRLDLLTANGHLEEDINRVQPSQHYEQPPHLFWNAGPQANTEFLPVRESQSGPDLFKPLVGRGAAYADIDGDGDLDVLVTAAGQPPRLLRNDQKLGHHWLRCKLAGTHSNRDAIGAQIGLELEDGVLCRQVMPSRSYLSQVELPVTFGLGSKDKVRRLTVYWPRGAKQSVEV